MIRATAAGPPHEAGRVFVKHGDAANLAAEAAGLAALAATATVRTPRVGAGGTAADGRAFLELEFLDLAPLDRASGAALGRQFAALHRCTAERFGWAEDNFIGLGHQRNGWCDNWPRFFAERRLAPQLHLAAANGAGREFVARGENLLERIPAFFVAGHPRPSLLHGDLWGGNAGRLPDGTPAVFDPACHYGDREADIAMTELFGGFPDAFQAAYREVWPLPPEYETRKTLYNLHHILNHYNIFGAGYLGQARRMVDRLLAELR